MKLKKTTKKTTTPKTAAPNPLFALRSGTLATLREIEAAALEEIESDIFLSGEQEDLICIIPSLCQQIRVEAQRKSRKQ